MAADALIDTGAILALLDRTDRWHHVCVDAFPQLRLPLLTSQAVLAELFHLLGDSRREMETAWKFIRSGAISLTRSCRAIGIAEWISLTPPWSILAKREGLPTVFTVDRADFDSYRIEGRKRFRIFPATQP
jgi:predicted nucleic acid-binding protein